MQMEYTIYVVRETQKYCRHLEGDITMFPGFTKNVNRSAVKSFTCQDSDTFIITTVLAIYIRTFKKSTFLESGPTQISPLFLIWFIFSIINNYNIDVLNCLFTMLCSWHANVFLICCRSSEGETSG